MNRWWRPGTLFIAGSSRAAVCAQHVATRWSLQLGSGEGSLRTPTSPGSRFLAIRSRGREIPTSDLSMALRM